MGITKLRRGVHFIRDTEAAKYLRRHLNDPDLITFFNAETGQYVLAYWVNRDRAIVDEIDDLGPNFEVMTHEFIRSLEESRRGTDPKELKRKLLRNAKRRTGRELERLEEHNDQYDWMKKRTADKAPLPYMYGGGIKGGQATAQIG